MFRGCPLTEHMQAQSSVSYSPRQHGVQAREARSARSASRSRVMATAHAPCWDGWQSSDKDAFDDVWRVDFSIHCFSGGKVACSLLPVFTAEGEAFSSEVSDGTATPLAEDLITVVITSSPVRSNPSTRMLRECLASLDRNGGLSRCRKLIMCDGFKVRRRSQRKLGVVTDDESMLYRDYVLQIARLCREHDDFRRTRVVRLARRQGSAFAIREALSQARTPFVLIVPHDCVIARPVRLEAVAGAMQAHPERIHYAKLLGPSTTKYADAVLSQYGVRLQPTTEFGSALCLLPMLRYMDNVALVSVRYLEEEVFVDGTGVRRGTFIEDTFGKHFQMQAWLDSADFVAKIPPRNGCFLLTDDGTSLGEPMMRHLDGKTYLDPEQRAEANLPAYPTDWTARFAGAPREARVPRAEELVPLRDALCWDSLADGCSSVECQQSASRNGSNSSELIHWPRHNGKPVCGKHLTSELELWGRRRRPPCPGGCAKAHPTRDELELALNDAIREGSRLHVHLQSPPRLGCGAAQCARSLLVVPSDVSPAEADAALNARAPMALRVAVDVGFDGVMSEAERKSLATQCGLCHGIAATAEHRSHVRHTRDNPTYGLSS